MAIFKNYVCECKSCGKRMGPRKHQAIKPMGNPQYTTADRCQVSRTGKHVFVWREE